MPPEEKEAKLVQGEQVNVDVVTIDALDDTDETVKQARLVHQRAQWWVPLRPQDFEPVQ